MPKRRKYRECVRVENQPDCQATTCPGKLDDTENKLGRNTKGTGEEGRLTNLAIWNAPLIWLIKFYQRYITHLLPPSCRFEPSCSHYALQAFQKYPFYKALYFSIRRILKCHPFHKGGFDPLP
jgi:uncharacterized protein